MYCKNCGHELAESENTCTKCGAARGTGKDYCEICGTHVDEATGACPKCQSKTPETAVVETKPVVETKKEKEEKDTNPAREPKSKLVAGLLAIFLGSYGIHNFYLGYKQKATIQCAVSAICTVLACCTFGITAIGVLAMEIWGFVEGIMIFAGKIDKDGYGVPLKD